MTHPDNPTPAQYQGVMVSSTFKDLEEHRKALMRALRQQEFFSIGMEERTAGPGVQRQTVGSAARTVPNPVGKP